MSKPIRHPFRVQGYLKPINKEFVEQVKRDLRTESESEAIEHIIESFKKTYSPKKNSY